MSVRIPSKAQPNLLQNCSPKYTDFNPFIGDTAYQLQVKFFNSCLIQHNGLTKYARQMQLNHHWKVFFITENCRLNANSNHAGHHCTRNKFQNQDLDINKLRQIIKSRDIWSQHTFIKLWTKLCYKYLRNFRKLSLTEKVMKKTNTIICSISS